MTIISQTGIKGNVAGIYAIRYGQELYVGQSVKIQKRINCHLRDMRKKKHTNIHIQNIYNKHELNKFEFFVLYEVDSNMKSKMEKQELIDLLTIMEQTYFNLLSPTLNVLKKAKSAKGGKRTQESKDRASLLYGKPFSFFHETLGHIEGVNIRKFVKNNPYLNEVGPLDDGGLYSVLCGCRTQHKGFYRNKEEHDKDKAKKLGRKTSVHRGVSWATVANGWSARLKKNGKYCERKYYKNELEAAEFTLLARQVYDVS